MILAFELLTAASLAACVVRFGCAWKALREGRRGGAGGDGGVLPPVSILKPLKGVDDGLLDNLSGFCRLDYPEYEIVFCIQGASDPALRVARKVKEMHPGREIRIVASDCREGLNPKVNNMIPGYAAAKHPFVLISDSNVAPDPGYLREAMSHFRDPRVGLVTHFVRGVGAKTLGARLEAQHLNSFILPSVSLLDRVFSMPCVVGKSMLMRRSDLEELGGLRGVKDFLAEDYVLGERFHKAGKKVAVSSSPVDTVSVYRTVGQFFSRHARWNRMRFSIAGPAYFGELLANPVALSLVTVAAAGGDASSLRIAGTVVAAKAALDLSLFLAMGDRASARWAFLGPVRDLMAFGLWFSAFWSRSVEWRGRTLRIAGGSRLVPEGGPVVLEPGSTGLRAGEAR
ncbi:MAG: ceramide glucosyltransferase [Thermodesulfobacteriota bacterium]